MTEFLPKTISKTLQKYEIKKRKKNRVPCRIRIVALM